MTARATFKQANLRRALKVAMDAGLRPSSYEIRPDRAIRIMLGSDAVDGDMSDLDAQFAAFGRR